MKIELSKQATKVMTKLDKPTKQRIKTALEKVPDDLEHIAMARQELASGETTSFDDMD